MIKPKEQANKPRNLEELRAFVWALAKENKWSKEDVMAGKYDDEIYASLGYNKKEDLYKDLGIGPAAKPRAGFHDGRWSQSSKTPIKPPRKRPSSIPEQKGIDVTQAAAIATLLAGFAIALGNVISDQYQKGLDTRKTRHESSIQLAKEVIEAKGMEKRRIHPYTRCSADMANKVNFPFGQTMSPEEIFEACSTNW